jgi:hypothetical protein
MLLTTEGAPGEEQQQLMAQIVIEHAPSRALYEKQRHHEHYAFFWSRSDRIDNYTAAQYAFDRELERVLVFLVEAIGVPVLLSLLLLTYSNMSGDVISLERLPENRLELYKHGITSGIANGCLPALEQSVAPAAELPKVVEGQVGAQVVERNKRETRKQALTLSHDASRGKKGGGKDSEKKKSVDKEAPKLDVNKGVVRGKTLQVFRGWDETAHLYTLTVEILSRLQTQPTRDLRTTINAIVPFNPKAGDSDLDKRTNEVVSALVEYVNEPLKNSEADLLIMAKEMLRSVAVANQEVGRREFTSRDVTWLLCDDPERLCLWIVNRPDRSAGRALC